MDLDSFISQQIWEGLYSLPNVREKGLYQVCAYQDIDAKMFDAIFNKFILPECISMFLPNLGPNYLV